MFDTNRTAHTYKLVEHNVTNLYALSSQIVTEPSINTDTVPVHIVLATNKQNINSLFDTGALQGNYIRKETIENLLKSKLMETQKCNVNVCAAFNACQHSSLITVARILFNDDEFSNK